MNKWDTKKEYVRSLTTVDKEGSEAYNCYYEIGDWNMRGKSITAGDPMNAVKALNNMDIELRHNRFTDEVEFNGKTMTDIDGNAIRIQIGANFGFTPSKAAFNDAVSVIAHENGYDPMQDWIRSLVWDKQPRLYHMATEYYDIQEEDEDKLAYYNQALALIVRGMVARIIKPGIAFDYCPILHSRAEGTGKTKSLKVLAGGDDMYTGNIILDINGSLQKHIIEETAGKIMACSEELSGLKGSDIAKVKAMITETTDSATMKYDKRATMRPRRFILCATTNEYHTLKDRGDNRRFPMVDVGKNIALDKLKGDRDQLFAEAFAYFDDVNSVSVTMPELMWDYHRQFQKDRQISTEFGDWLEDRLTWHDEPVFFTTGDLQRSMRDDGIKRIHGQFEDELGRLGFTYAKVHGPKWSIPNKKRVHIWYQDGAQKRIMDHAMDQKDNTWTENHGHGPLF